jgi:hypothetical protein
MVDLAGPGRVHTRRTNMAVKRPKKGAKKAAKGKKKAGKKAAKGGAS